MVKFLLACLFIVVLMSCGSGGVETYTKAEDAQDAGREFIRASLDGKFDKAKFYLLKDSSNITLFDRWKTSFYDKLSTEDRISYQNANILPINIENIDDSTVSYVFTNSFKNKDTTNIKIIRLNGEWLVDFTDLHSYYGPTKNK